MASSDLATLRGADLVFYEDDHSYWSPPGRDGGCLIEPSVTKVLRACGISEDFDAIERANPGVVSFKRDLGTVVHADTHAYDDDDLDLESVDARVLPYLKAWIAWRENFRATPTQRERRIYHPGLHYVGTLDGIFEIGAKRVLIDVKCGDPVAAGCQYQTSAYEAAYLAEYPNERIDERWSVQLTPDNGIPYRVTPYSDWSDFRKFQCFLTTYHCQAARRRAR